MKDATADVISGSVAPAPPIAANIGTTVVPRLQRARGARVSRAAERARLCAGGVRKRERAPQPLLQRGAVRGGGLAGGGHGGAHAPHGARHGGNAGQHVGARRLRARAARRRACAQARPGRSGAASTRRAARETPRRTHAARTRPARTESAAAADAAEATAALRARHARPPAPRRSDSAAGRVRSCAPAKCTRALGAAAAAAAQRRQRRRMHPNAATAAAARTRTARAQRRTHGRSERAGRHGCRRDAGKTGRLERAHLSLIHRADSSGRRAGRGG
jgi:hypothetical protein